MKTLEGTNRLGTNDETEVAALREKTTRKKRLTDRARTFRKSGLDVQKKYAASGRGAFFYLTSPFIGQCYMPCGLTK